MNAPERIYCRIDVDLTDTGEFLGTCWRDDDGLSIPYVRADAIATPPAPWTDVARDWQKDVADYSKEVLASVRPAPSPDVAIIERAILDAQLRCMEQGRIDTPEEIRAAALAMINTPPAPPPDVAAVDLAMLRKEHAEWSQAQFGDVSSIGPAKHLAKEALEVAADPTDVVEHADCWMLLWDMQRRAGISDDQLAEAIKTKLAINKARIWPAPKEGEAREHDRDAPAPSTDVAALLWMGIESAPKGEVTESVGCRDVSEWFLGRVSPEFRENRPPFIVIRRRAWPQDDGWECAGDAYYVPRFFDAWAELPAALTRKGGDA